MFTAFHILTSALCLTIALSSTGILLPALFGAFAGVPMATLLIDLCDLDE